MRSKGFKLKLVPRRQFLLGAASVMSSAIVGGSLGESLSNVALAENRYQRLRSATLTGLEPVAAKVHPTTQSLIDTIIPADESVGAIKLGLHTKLTEEMAKQPRTKEWIERLTQSVSQKSLTHYLKEFHLANIDQREQFLNALLANKANTVIGKDLSRLRELLITWYYLSVEGATSIGFYLPAQYPSYPGKK